MNNQCIDKNSALKQEQINKSAQQPNSITCPVRNSKHCLTATKNKTIYQQTYKPKPKPDDDPFTDY